MPAEFWKACSRTSNGNEQAHRSINRDGTGLTLLAGVMHGQEYDERAFRSIAIHNSYGINTRYQASTHHFRASRSVSQHGKLAIGRISLTDITQEQPPSIRSPHSLELMNMKSMKTGTRLQTRASVIIKSYRIRQEHTSTHSILEYISFHLRLRASRMLSIRPYEGHLNILLQTTIINPESQPHTHRSSDSVPTAPSQVH